MSAPMHMRQRRSTDSFSPIRIRRPVTDLTAEQKRACSLLADRARERGRKRDAISAYGRRILRQAAPAGTEIREEIPGWTEEIQAEEIQLVHVHEHVREIEEIQEAQAQAETEIQEEVQKEAPGQGKVREKPRLLPRLGVILPLIPPISPLLFPLLLLLGIALLFLPTVYSYPASSRQEAAVRASAFPSSALRPTAKAPPHIRAPLPHTFAPEPKAATSPPLAPPPDTTARVDVGGGKTSAPAQVMKTSVAPPTTPTPPAAAPRTTTPGVAEGGGVIVTTAAAVPPADPTTQAAAPTTPTTTPTPRGQGDGGGAGDPGRGDAPGTTARQEEEGSPGTTLVDGGVGTGGENRTENTEEKKHGAGAGLEVIFWLLVLLAIILVLWQTKAITHCWSGWRLRKADTSGNHYSEMQHLRMLY